MGFTHDDRYEDNATNYWANEHSDAQDDRANREEALESSNRRNAYRLDPYRYGAAATELGDGLYDVAPSHFGASLHHVTGVDEEMLTAEMRVRAGNWSMASNMAHDTVPGPGRDRVVVPDGVQPLDPQALFSHFS